MSKQIKMAIEDKYKSMDEISHILHRPGMYIGSTSIMEGERFILSEDNEFGEPRMSIQNVSHIPGVLKLIDEVLSNSVDEFRRGNKFGLNEISVGVHEMGKVIIIDNGGIPVEWHKHEECMVPEMIFGRFRTSTNYNDDEMRNGVGTNGYGAKLANVFSTKFMIETADNKKSFKQIWKNNMRELDLVDAKGNSEPEIKAARNKHYTKTSFMIDWSKFNSVKSIDYTFARIIEKRCVDAAGSNPGLKVNFQYDVGDNDNRSTKIKSTWYFNEMDEYIKLYSDYIDLDNCIKHESDAQSVWVFPDSNINVGFVNGAECSDPKGKHIESLRSDVNEALIRELKNVHNIDINGNGLRNRYSLFCNVLVMNPKYDSQTKEKLDTLPENFSGTGKKYPIPKSFFESITKSEIIQNVLDWHKQKTAAENSRETRRANKDLKNKVRSKKFIDINGRVTNDSELWIFEGDSAKSGFRNARDPQRQACYLLKGVIKNVLSLGRREIMASEELRDLVSIIGLQFGDIDVNKLNFKKIYICTDMDHDGNKIAGLLFAFFNTHFPQLVEAGMLYRVLSPIIIATKRSDIVNFFSLDEYRAVQDKYSGYSIKYTKGLGGLKPSEYKEMMQQSKMHRFYPDGNTQEVLEAWFGRDVSKRKAILEETVMAD